MAAKDEDGKDGFLKEMRDLAQLMQDTLSQGFFLFFLRITCFFFVGVVSFTCFLYSFCHIALSKVCLVHQVDI